MNDITLLREAGPEAPQLRSDVRSAARAALLAEIGAGRTAARRRLLIPSRKTGVRIGAGVAVAAVAWTAAVVIAAPDAPGPPPGSVRLVAFTPPTFPLSVAPVPPGLTPEFDGDRDTGSIAAYRDAAQANGFTIWVSDSEPDLEDMPGRDVTDVKDVELAKDVELGRRDAELVTGREDHCDVDDEGTASNCAQRPFAVLITEWRDGQWVSLSGEGRYTDPRRLQQIADSLVDRPQPITLQVGLAPAGWSVLFYKMGRVLTLASDTRPDQELSVHLPLPDDVVPADQVATSIEGPTGPMRPVVVNGRPAQLVPTDYGWFLQAQFADGRTFVVQAPKAFTQEQVLEVAAEVTYHP
jgi:hypothetical protein